MASDQIINEVVRRIVETARPRKIILFGSAERGAMGPNSDLDVLVVIPCSLMSLIESDDLGSYNSPQNSS